MFCERGVGEEAEAVFKGSQVTLMRPKGRASDKNVTRDRGVICVDGELFMAFVNTHRTEKSEDERRDPPEVASPRKFLVGRFYSTYG